MNQLIKVTITLAWVLLLCAPLINPGRVAADESTVASAKELIAFTDAVIGRDEEQIAANQRACSRQDKSRQSLPHHRQCDRSKRQQTES